MGFVQVRSYINILPKEAPAVFQEAGGPEAQGLEGQGVDVSLPQTAWRQVRTMALVFAAVSLAQLVLSVAWLGLRPGRGSYVLILLQLGLVLAFAALTVYADSHLRQARREQREQRERDGRSA